MAVKTSQLQPKTDPAQPEDPDAKVLIGGPGQDEPQEEAPPQPQVREITIGGRKFAVDPDLAQSLEQRERDFDRKLNEHDRELGELRKLKQSYTPEVPKEQPKGYSTLLFENPDEAVKRIQDEVIQKVTNLYTQDKSQEKFWNDFYRHNTDLDRTEDDFMVKAVLNEHFDELAPMRPDQARDKLADYTRRQLLRLAQKAKLTEDEDDNKPAPRTRVEPASRSMPRAPAREPEGPSSLTDAIRAKQQARAAARRPAAQTN